MTTLDLDKLTTAELQELHDKFATAAEFQRFNQYRFYTPYPKQLEFLSMGSEKTERLLMAGNQLGKTFTGAYEAAMHATGRYPDWWKGRKWNHATKGWVLGETSLLTRDTPQKYLCGEPGVADALGTGMIPLDAFIDKPSLSRGVTDAYDTVQVRHVSGGTSLIKFKSYEQGRAKLQSDTIDWAWCDEEPPPDIYSEIVTRTTATHGSIFTTFTPLKGMTGTVDLFLGENVASHRGLVNMTIYDAPHIKDPESIIARWPAHEQEARALGIPMLGSGRIFTTPEEAFRIAIDFDIPPYWACMWAIDFGIDHPFAAVLVAWDRDNDILYVLAAVRKSDLLPRDHAALMRDIAPNPPVAWPQDGTTRQTDGQTLAMHYKRHGLNMLPSHATWPNGGYDTEAGIMEMQDRLASGRLLVNSQLTDWFEEYRLYHRKDGKIINLRDDLPVGYEGRLHDEALRAQQYVWRAPNPAQARQLDSQGGGL